MARTNTKGMNNGWYRFFKYVLIGPWLRVWNRPFTEGLDNVPRQGSAMFVSNHQAVMDSFYLPLICPRQLTFPAKKEYFTGTGFVGAIQRFFFTSVGQVPIDRTAKDAGDALIDTAKTVFARDDILGIYPEGTRSPDGRIYRGRTGMARIAMATNVDVIPVAMINTAQANPIGSWIPRPARVGVRFGKAISPHKWADEHGLNPEDHQTMREFTDFVMRELAELTGTEYVDRYASEVKDSLQAGNGYPEGTEPNRA